MHWASDFIGRSQRWAFRIPRSGPFLGYVRRSRLGKEISAEREGAHPRLRILFSYCSCGRSPFLCTCHPNHWRYAKVHRIAHREEVNLAASSAQNIPSGSGPPTNSSSFSQRRWLYVPLNYGRVQRNQRS